MKFVVKQAAGAPEEKPVELSIEVVASGDARIMANGSIILMITPKGTVQLVTLNSEDRSLGFVADRDGFIEVRGRIPG